MVRFLAAAFVLLLPVGQALAQPKRNDLQPDRLDFGTLYRGSIVEASVQLYEPGTDPAINFEVTAPKFVKVLDKKTEARTFGPGNAFVCGSVFLSIDTSTAGDFKGDLQMTLGGAAGKVPVRAVVKAPRKGLARLLVVETPFCRYSTKDGAEFKAWTDTVNAAPIDPTYLLTEHGKPVLRDLDLSKYNCILLAESGIVSLTPGDLKRVRAFAEAGGRVVVAADRFMRGSAQKANAVCSGYGLEMRDEETRGGKHPGLTVSGTDLDQELDRNGVNAVRFYRVSPIAVTDPMAGRVLVKAAGVGQPGDGFVAVAKAGKGEVAVVGQSLWWHWISGPRTKDADNAKLLRWLLIRRMQ